MKVLENLSGFSIITTENAREIIDTREPRGLFCTRDNGGWVLIDNRTGDAWTEELSHITDDLGWAKAITLDSMDRVKKALDTMTATAPIAAAVDGEVIHPRGRAMAAAERFGVIEAIQEELLDATSKLLTALEPSPQTKAAYCGTFRFMVDDLIDDDGEPMAAVVTVPWTTVKEIMAAIRRQAGLK